MVLVLRRPLTSSLAAIALGFLQAAPMLAAVGRGSVGVTLNKSVVVLNGPWRFQTGDNTLWADPAFDDSAWETVDLTPPPGAHDADVGLSGYVPGWQRRGHPGYFGYGWYRIHIHVSAPAGAALALSGPPAVESAYQVFFDGHLVGSAGDFSSSPPVAYSIQPRQYGLPLTQAPSERPRAAVLAFRVWMGPWGLADPNSGGVHIAPALGTRDGIEARFRLQWLETVLGYIVDAVEALGFAALAAIACFLVKLKYIDSSNVWMVAALVLTSVVRANQAFFFWGQTETVHGFEWITVVLLTPTIIAAWVLSWHAWFRLNGGRWEYGTVTLLTLLYMIAQFLNRSWFYGEFSPWAKASAHIASTWSRYLFLLLMLIVVFRGVRKQRRAAWIELPGVALISVGLFAQELSSLGVRSIWFPFGTGVSRTQFAYAAFGAALFGMFFRRVLLSSRQIRTQRERSTESEVR